MSKANKTINDLEEYKRVRSAFDALRELHVLIWKDSEALFEIMDTMVAMDFRMEAKESLERALIRNFFALIEADLYNINQIVPYKNYKENDDFKKKFKNTFKEIGRWFNRMEIYFDYASKEMCLLFKIRDVRDRITHPKSKDMVILNDFNINNLRLSIKSYKEFFTQIAWNFTLTINLP